MLKLVIWKRRKKLAKEILAVPEGRLREFIYILRAGIEYSQAIPLDPLAKFEMISYETIHALSEWCNDEEKYLDDLEER